MRRTAKTEENYQKSVWKEKNKRASAEDDSPRKRQKVR